ncbi:sulfatase-like hydrolase/transferase [Tautonia sp. JC769]|uniref:sulfatase family protein n=1 Tax=Tautonia sp. JC769 TaxID=3232135 RepID=UPI00345A4B37
MFGTPKLLDASSRPNVITVFIDDMGWGDPSCFGNRTARTPQIDRLAEEGIRFTNFYVNSPICSPSRVAISTGRYPQRHRITSFLNNRRDNARRGMADWLDPEAPMLARILQEHGYATGHFGKWHMGGQRNVDDAPPISAYGFEASLTNFEGMGAKLLPLTFEPGQQQPGRIWADAERLGGPVTWMPRSEITGGFVDAALAFIEEATRAGRPFYVNLWPDDVHTPLWPPVEAWGDGSRRAKYRAVLEAMDAQLAPLFDRIRATPELRDNTLIVLCSDNGPEPGCGSAGPFRGSKGTLFEGGIRSPLIVWGPGPIPRESRGEVNDSSILSAIDLVPSVLSIAGIAPPEGVDFDGEDMGETLVGKSRDSRSAPLFFRRPPDRKDVAGLGELPDLAVRLGRWKLLCDYDGGRARLHDLEADPGEAHDLADEHPEVVASLTRAVLDWHAAMPPDRGPALGVKSVQGPSDGKVDR